MRSGYEIHWTSNALGELEKTIEYLTENFSEKEIKRLVRKIESTVKLISQNPYLFQKSEHENIYRVPILKLNTLYYRVNKEKLEILSFFSNRQNPKKRRV